MTIAAAVLLLVAPGVVPASSVAGGWLTVVCLAPVVTCLLAAVAAAAALVTRTPVLPWFAVVTIAVHVLAARRERNARPAPDPRLALVIVLAAVAPLVALRTADAGWDARSIWFLHARWFLGGGSYTWDAMGSSTYLFSHPDYPPLVPAIVAVVWRLTGSIDLRVAQVVVAVLNAAGLGLVGLAIGRVVPRDSHVAVTVGAAAAATATVMAGWGLAGTYGTNGYVDLTWAALAVAACIHLLALPTSSTTIAVGVVAAIAAGLTKNEAIPAVVAIVSLAALRHRRPWLLLAALPVLTWPLLARLTGARSDFLGGTLPPGAPRAVVHHVGARLGPSWRAVRSWEWDPFIPAAVVSIAGLVAVRQVRHALGVAATAWSWAVVGVMTAATVAAYVVSPYDLAWHLGTSVERTTVAARLLLYAEAAIWSTCAAAAVQRRFATTMPPRSKITRNDDEVSESNNG